MSTVAEHTFLWEIEIFVTWTRAQIDEWATLKRIRTNCDHKIHPLITMSMFRNAHRFLSPLLLPDLSSFPIYPSFSVIIISHFGEIRHKNIPFLNWARPKNEYSTHTKTNIRKVKTKKIFEISLLEWFNRKRGKKNESIIMSIDVINHASLLSVAFAGPGYAGRQAADGELTSPNSTWGRRLPRLRCFSSCFTLIWTCTCVCVRALNMDFGLAITRSISFG